MAKLIITALALLAVACGGATDSDQPDPAPVRTVLEPLSIECVDHTDCPRSHGYRTCHANRCSFRCDAHVHTESGETLTNADACVARGGECVDVGAGNLWCEVR